MDRLRLAPVNPYVFSSNHGSVTAITSFLLEDRRVLAFFEEGGKLANPKPIPAGMSIMGIPGENYEVTQDCWGRTLTFFQAQRLKEELQIPKDSGCDYKATMAYIRELTDETPIILIWE